MRIEVSQRSVLTRQVEDLKEQLGARADSEYALQEENRRLQVELSLFFILRHFAKKSPKIDVVASKIWTKYRAGGGDEGELREEETEHGERAALLEDEPADQVKTQNAKKGNKETKVNNLSGKVRATSMTTPVCRSATARAPPTPFLLSAVPGFCW